MSLAMTLVGGWILATGVVGVFAWSLGRAAAIGDRQDYGLAEIGAAVPDRRMGPSDRRDLARRRLAGAPGRRSEDPLPGDVRAAELDLAETEALVERERAARARRAG